VRPLVACMDPTTSRARRRPSMRIHLAAWRRGNLLKIIEDGKAPKEPDRSLSEYACVLFAAFDRAINPTGSSLSSMR